MIRFEKPKKNLEEFLKDEKNTFAKKKLLKTGLAIGAAVVAINLSLDNAVLAQHNNIDQTAAAFISIPGTQCVRLTPTHTQHNQHVNHSNHSSHASY